MIELALVMVIVGLLVGFGSSLVVPLSHRAKRIESQDIVNSAVESVIGFAATNGRLPKSLTEFYGIITKRNDANGRPLSYFFSSQLISQGSICNRKTTDLSTLCTPSGCANTVANVAFIVASGGVNINPQTGRVTTGCSSGTCIGVEDVGTPAIDNCSNSTDCPNTYYNNAFARMDRPEEYDDIVKWVTLNELKSKAACEGPPLKILNTELPPASLSSLPYTVTFYAEGGIPFGGGYNWGILLPAGITATSPAAIAATDPYSLAEDSGMTWNQSPSLTLSISAISAIGTYPIYITVRDNNDPGDTSGADTQCDSTNNEDNCATKPFVLTVNP